MKTIFIMNPCAGEKSGLGELKEKLSRCEGAGNCRIYITTAPRNATEYVRTYCEEHPGEPVRFIACGGDGTLNEVVNGAVGYDQAEVGIYPCGSGNDFVKSWGGAEKFLDVEKLLKAGTRKIDLLKIGDRYSDNVVNFGFDTTVAITVNEGREKKGSAGKSYYTKGIIRALIKSMRNEFKLWADGELLNPDGIALLCTIGNGQYVGGSFRCAPRASMEDGLMEICLVKPISRLRFIKLIGFYTRGEHLDNPDMQSILIYRQAKQVHVTAPEGFAWSLDGEIIYENDFTVEVVPKAINFVIPE